MASRIIANFGGQQAFVRTLALSVSNGLRIFADMAKSQAASYDDLTEACLETLRSLSPSVRARFSEPRAREQRHPDGRLHLETGQGSVNFLVQTTRTHLSYAVASGLIEQARASKEPWILFAPYVPGKIGHHLAANRINYADTVGNC